MITGRKAFSQPSDTSAWQPTCLSPLSCCYFSPRLTFTVVIVILITGLIWRVYVLFMLYHWILLTYSKYQSWSKAHVGKTWRLRDENDIFLFLRCLWEHVLSTSSCQNIYPHRDKCQYCVIGQNFEDVFLQKNDWTTLVSFCCSAEELLAEAVR